MMDKLYILPPPSDEAMLMHRARCVAGCRLGELAQQLNLPIPKDLRRDKGWVGQLLEIYLGASAGSKAEPDFPHLGIELKTVPVGRNGKPLETTFICVAPLMQNTGVIWETSHVKRKLQRVLWIPVEGERDIPLAERRIGLPVLWSPSPEEEGQLRKDWEELMDLIVLGQIESLTARLGEVMQIRPKAANGKALTEAIGAEGYRILTRPRGFYLKKPFTYRILTGAVTPS